jgi:hypothetical protein
MKRFYQIVAALLLVCMTLTGQFSPCFCAVEPPHEACADHDHSNAPDPDQDERQCPCPTCHRVCMHMTFALQSAGFEDPALVVNEYITNQAALNLPIVVAEIFTPPKVA